LLRVCFFSGMFSFMEEPADVFYEVFTLICGKDKGPPLSLEAVALTRLCGMLYREAKNLQEKYGHEKDPLEAVKKKVLKQMAKGTFETEVDIEFERLTHNYL